MEFESMVVYRTWMETFDDLDNETVGEVIKMMMHYGMDGEDISDQMSPAARAIFKMSKGNIDANKQKRTSGAKGGKAKGKQKESKPKANGKQTESKTQADEKQTATNENDNENENVNENIKPSLSPRSASDARFDIFWQTYPRKAGRESALKVWKEINPDSALFEKIIKKVEELKTCEDWKKENGRFVPNPQKWLESGGWDDEIPKSRSPGKKKNSFQNFTGRERTDKDYEDIERELLGIRRTG